MENSSDCYFNHISLGQHISTRVWFLNQWQQLKKPHHKPTNPSSPSKTKPKQKPSPKTSYTTHTQKLHTCPLLTIMGIFSLGFASCFANRYCSIPGFANPGSLTIKQNHKFIWYLPSFDICRITCHYRKKPLGFLKYRKQLVWITLTTNDLPWKHRKSFSYWYPAFICVINKANDCPLSN